MKIIGVLLIAFGIIWVISRFMNQSLMMRNYRNGNFSASRYFFTELFTGFGLGILFIYIGYRLFN